MEPITLPRKERKVWIDVLRALAILFVVYGHRAGTMDYFLFTSPIKMPLFFALSGYLFNMRKGNDAAFLKNLFWSVVVPWICLGFFPIAAAFPIKGVDHTLQSLYEVLSGRKLWFMPCFIFGEIFFYYLLKALGKRHVLLLVATLVLFMVGYALRQRHILSFGMISIAMTVQVYFAFGYLFRQYEETIKKWPAWSGYATALIYVLLGVVSLFVYPRCCLNVNVASYYNIPLCMAMIATGLFSLFVLSQKIRNYPKWLQLVGKNSLVIYMLDRYAIIPAHKLYDFSTGHYPLLGAVSLVYLVWSSFFAIMIAKVLNRYAPWATGRRG